MTDVIDLNEYDPEVTSHVHTVGLYDLSGAEPDRPFVQAHLVREAMDVAGRNGMEILSPDVIEAVKYDGRERTDETGRMLVFRDVTEPDRFVVVCPWTGEVEDA